MADFFYWTGVVIWALVAAAIVWLIILEFLIVGLATSISRHRWQLSDPQSKFVWHKHWWPLLKSAAEGCIEYAGYRNNGSVRLFTERGGEWKGIGDWIAIPSNRKDKTP